MRYNVDDYFEAVVKVVETNVEGSEDSFEIAVVGLHGVELLSAIVDEQELDECFNPVTALNNLREALGVAEGKVGDIKRAIEEIE